MSGSQSSDQWEWSVHTMSWAGAWMWLKNNLEDPWWMLMEGGTHQHKPPWGLQPEKDDGW